MGNSKLVIRPEQVNSKGLCVIYVLYTHNSKNTYFTTSEKVPLKSWDSKNCRVKSSFRGYTVLNDYLEQFKEDIDVIKRTLRLQRVEPTTDALKSEFEKLKQPKVERRSFFDVYDSFLLYQEKNKKVSPDTIKQYRSFKERIKQFQNKKLKKITLESIDHKFYSEFVDYLELELKMKANTAGNHVKILKSFMQWCCDNGFQNQIKSDYKKFKKPKSESTIIALSLDELNHFWEHEFKNKSLEKVRDIFVFACVTGMRFSDVSRVSINNIIKEKNCISIYTQKTKEEVEIPLVHYSKTILEKYNYNLKVISNQKMNDYLKIAAKEAGLDSLRRIKEVRGRETQIIEKPLYSLITFHCGRRSFSTISLEIGMPMNQVMAITGHRSLQSFQRYVTHSKSELVKSMNEKWESINFQTKIPKIDCQ